MVYVGMATKDKKLHLENLKLKAEIALLERSARRTNVQRLEIENAILLTHIVQLEELLQQARGETEVLHALLLTFL
jgi:Tfp pilus assembly protein PilN